MGNTTNIPITISPPITQNPVLNVHQNSNPNFAPNSEQKEEKENDFLREHSHKSSRIVPGQKDSADRSGGSSGPNGREKVDWNDDDIMHDAVDDADGVSIQSFAHAQSKSSTSLVPVPTSTAVITQPQAQPVFDRVFTTAHPVKTTKSTVPPFPARVIQSDDAHLDVHGKPVSGSYDKKTIMIRVDMRSPSSPFYGFWLSSSRSNNLTSLRRALWKASELTKTKFNPNEIFHGMNQGNVQLFCLSKIETETLEDEIKLVERDNAAAAAAAAQNGSGLDPLTSSVITSSAPPSVPSSLRSVRVPQLWSHKYTITFDTVQNTKTAYAVLSSMKLSPILPSPHIITGIFWGLPFDAPHEKKQAHFQQEAWYEGGAPSFIYTPIEQTDTVVQGFTSSQFRDECYFSCLSTHWNHVQSMPSFNGRPFTFQKYKRSKVMVCYHCNQVGHKAEACASKHIPNSAGQRDACIMCGSFEHVNASCPARNDPAATCMLCKKGKHTVRACPLYRGSYKRVAQRQHTQTSHKQKAWGTTNNINDNINDNNNNHNNSAVKRNNMNINMIQISYHILQNCMRHVPNNKIK